MKSNSKLTEKAKLESFRIALTNVNSNPTIFETLRGYGVADKVFEAGNSLYAAAKEKVQLAELARVKLSNVYKIYVQTQQSLIELYYRDRRKAGVAFVDNPSAQDMLALNKGLEQSYVQRIAKLTNFYTVLAENPELTAQLADFGISQEDIPERLKALTAFEKTRADYINEKGNSQNATTAKHNAMSSLSNWMTKFIELARNAFIQEPQLMESLNIVVKS